MAAEQVLRMLDSFWFETTILTNNKTSSISNLHPTIDSNPKLEEVLLPLDSNLLMFPNLEVRSYSDQNLDSTTCDFCDFSSPNSVLTPQKLRTIPSEKEIRDFKNHEKERTNQSFGHERRRRRRPNKGKTRTSRSLTELEFKELKGFMDLGFVFSEEDKDSKLVSLIPGLMRLGREEEEEAEKDDEEKQNTEENVISNEPYLSEAWDVLEQREKRNPLLNWRIPIRGNEIDMKDNLKFWAHTVASIVR